MSHEKPGQQEQKQDERREYTDKPEVTNEHRQRAAEMTEAYEETRPTTVLPGSHRSVAGTAVTDWVDDDGNPKYGNGAENGTQERSGHQSR